MKTCRQGHDEVRVIRRHEFGPSDMEARSEDE